MVLLFGSKESEEGNKFPRKKLIFRKVKSFDKIIYNAKKIFKKWSVSHIAQEKGIEKKEIGKEKLGHPTTKKDPECQLVSKE